jgi:hypothetical protein
MASVSRKRPAKPKRESFRRRMSKMPYDELPESQWKMAKVLGFQDDDEMDHAVFRDSVRRFKRRSAKKARGEHVEPCDLIEPGENWLHGPNCKYSDVEFTDSSSGEETDEDVQKSGAKIIAENKKKRVSDDDVLDASFEAELLEISESFDGPKKDNQVVPVTQAKPMVGLGDMDPLTPELVKSKLRNLFYQFYECSGIWPTLQIATNKFISCQFSPKAANDQEDVYGMKFFYLHCSKDVSHFADCRTNVIPLSVRGMRLLVSSCHTIQKHAVTLGPQNVQTTSTLTPHQGKITLENNIVCKPSGNSGKVIMTLIYAQKSGDPLCKIEFEHRKPGGSGSHSFQFVVAATTVVHMIHNVFPLIREFQSLIFDKAEEMRKRLDVVAPDVSAEGRQIVNMPDSKKKHISWEYGISKPETQFLKDLLTK